MYKIALRRCAAIILMLTITTPLAQAADFSDPDWPCIQRKVPNLSIGQMWAGPPTDAEAVAALADDPEIAAAAQAIALRRTSMEDVESRIADFAESAGDEAARADRLTALFLRVFDLINAERSQIIAGIARYAHRQEDLSQRIEANRMAFAEQEAADEPDFDLIDQLEEALDWDQRIFRDRAQSLVYVCETPVILEQRAFAVARVVMNELP